MNSDIDTKTNTDMGDQVKFEEEVAYVKKQTSTSYYYVHNINIFSKFSGFDQLLKLMQSIDPTSLEIIKSKPNLKLFIAILNFITSMR